MILNIYERVIFITIVLLVIGFATKSDNFICKRLEVNYVNCEHQTTFFYGLIRGKNQSFQLKGANTKKKIKRTDEADFYLYEVYLETNQGLVKFDSRKDHLFLFWAISTTGKNWAYNQEAKIENFIQGNGEPPYLHYRTKGFRGYIFQTLKVAVSAFAIYIVIIFH